MGTNHQTQVLTHLKTGKTLLQAEAIYHFDCYCPSAVVERLRKQGHNIMMHQESNLNKKGTHARDELNGVSV